MFRLPRDVRFPLCIRTELQDLLPGILNQMGPDSLTNLKRMMAQVRSTYRQGKEGRTSLILYVLMQMGAGGFPGAGAAAADDDDDGGSIFPCIFYES